MENLQQTLERSNRAIVDLLLVDANMAHTFLDLARTAKTRELKIRRINRAAEAYNFICQRMPLVRLTPSETRTLNHKLRALEIRFRLN